MGSGIGGLPDAVWADKKLTTITKATAAPFVFLPHLTIRDLYLFLLKKVVGCSYLAHARKSNGNCHRSRCNPRKSLKCRPTLLIMAKN
jgi:hypothetical protein